MAERDLAELGCEDCPARVLVSRSVGIAGPVLVVAVGHERSCPWLARVAPSGEHVGTSARGIVLHHVRGAEPAGE